MVPAAILGLDLASILRARCRWSTSAAPTTARVPRSRPALGAGVRTGRDKLTIEAWGPFGDWVEQLVAESTG